MLGLGLLLLIWITWEEEMWRGWANHIDTAVPGWHFEAPWLSRRAGTNRQTKCGKIHPLAFRLPRWQLPFRGGGRARRRNSIEWWGTTRSTNIWISSHHCNEYLSAVWAWVAYSPSLTHKQTDTYTHTHTHTHTHTTYFTVICFCFEPCFSHVVTWPFAEDTGL